MPRLMKRRVRPAEPPPIERRPDYTIGRGVYLAHYRIDGCQVLVAVSRTGELLKHEPIPATQLVVEAFDAMQVWLDVNDPILRLAVV